MKMNIKSALKFQFLDLVKSCIGFFVTILVVSVVFPLMKNTLNGDMNISFSGFGVIAAVFMFVVGIVAPRSYIRLNIQMGVSRRTSFVTQLISVVAVSAVLSVAGELMISLLQAVFPSDEDILFADMYQIMYNDGMALSFGRHLKSIALNISIGVCAYICGMFYTLLFWRLNKLWSIVAAIGLVVLVNLVLGAAPVVGDVSWLSDMGRAFAESAAKGPAILIETFFIIAAVLAVIEWLLLKRANIRAAK